MTQDQAAEGSTPAATDASAPSCGSWRERQTVVAHAKPVSSLEFAPGGQLLATSSADTSVKIWRVDDTAALQPAPLATLYGHEAGVSAVSWSPDARHVISASDDHTARLWDVEAAKTLATLGATKRSLDAALSLPLSLLDGPNTGDAAASGESDSHSGFVSCAAFNPQGSLVATGSHDESVRLWDVRSGKAVALVAAHQEPVVSVGFHPTDGSLLLTAGYDGLVRVWDVASRQCLRTLVAAPSAPVGSARFSPNGRFVLSATLDGTLGLWDYMRELCVRDYRGHENRRFGLQTAFFQHDGRAVLACGSEDSRICLWDVASQRCDAVLSGHEHPVLALAACPQARLQLLVSGSNRVLKTWTPHAAATEGAVET